MLSCTASRGRRCNTQPRQSRHSNLRRMMLLILQKAASPPKLTPELTHDFQGEEINYKTKTWGGDLIDVHWRQRRNSKKPTRYLRMLLMPLSSSGHTCALRVSLSALHPVLYLLTHRPVLPIRRHLPLSLHHHHHGYGSDDNTSQVIHCKGSWTTTTTFWHGTCEKETTSLWDFSYQLHCEKHWWLYDQLTSLWHVYTRQLLKVS